MRLELLALDCYGPFLRQELVFDTLPGRINLLVAPNGAGKSVLRTAFGDLLFDLAHQSPMTFAHPASRLRLTARVRLPDGGTRLLVRRKGQGNTLSDGAAPIPQEDLRRLFGGADARLFRDLFALDSHGLREGGALLSRSSGRLGHMLLAGSGGLGHVQRLLEALVRDRDAIGRADLRQTAKPLWGAAEQAREAGRSLAQTALRPDAWLAMEKRAAEADRQLAALREERMAVDAELVRATALCAVRPWLARRDAALAVLAEAADVPRLEPGFEARWRRAVEEASRTAAAAAENARHAAEAKAAVAEQMPDTTMLAAAEAIEAVLQDAVTARNATRDLPEVAEKARQATAAAARLRSDLGWDAAVAVPPAPAVRAARDRIAGLAGLRGSVETADTEAIAAQAQLERARAELAALPEAADPAALAALVQEVRGAGLLARLETLRRTRLDAAAELARALARLPERMATRAALAATGAPPEAVLTAREAELGAAETAHRDALRECQRLAGELAGKRRALETLRRDAALPAAGALAAARALRDSLWDRVAAGGQDFLSVERAFRHADAVADALLRHAGEAARAEALDREIAGLVALADAAEAARAGSAAALDAARGRLAVLAEQAGGGDEALPAALRALLARREAALDRAVDLDRATEEEAAAEAALATARQRLALALDADGEVPALLERAETRVEAAREAARERKAALKELREAERTAAERDAAAVRKRAELAAWLETWRAMVSGLARPAGEPPETTGAALALVDELRRQEAAAVSDGARVRTMQAAVDGFASRMAALCARAAPALAALPPQDAAAQLRGMLKAQQAEAARQQALTERYARARDAAAAQLAAATEAAGALAALRMALRADDDAAAEAQLRQVARVAAAEADLAEARRHILGQGGGRSEAVLEALVAGRCREDDDAEMARLEARQRELGPLMEAAAADARSAAEARDRAGEGEDAQDAAARREAALATLARHTEEALVLHAAASLLRAGLEAGRDEAGSQAVARIGAVFRDLTCGVHAGVAVQDDGTDRVLVALEADGTACKQVDALSEGTRDQLFLALRIAALEAYVRTNPPLPFIADDVLQTFDDARALAALRALLDLSAHVQVIVLTHHPHVQALAARLPAGVVHTLVLSDLAEAA